MSWYDDYMAAFNSHDAEATLKFYAKNIVYKDFALNETFNGHDDMHGFVINATKMASDMHFKPLRFHQDGKQWAAEWLMTGTNDGFDRGLPPTNQKFSIQGATYGLLDDAGLIVENNDYWNMMDFLVQIGIMPPKPF